ncbi:pig-X [Schizosaccharomyces cryophilus OY26]|uniref:Protein PBN1 n=1 Tax=Schizosaccharomyces cryophilus (strain OY26 / ATCC MYA-4695 / CBS 11777 / NBRC 106824 / NRRL Y48691) TaxID=653667 RepID=S9X235_SCHCR|nr:pig-X [Schizosaccharomyces cryophilus OY26]EPY51172.1 pig-X [Schizosaccharomyces cryophilus OY26]
MQFFDNLKSFLDKNNPFSSFNSASDAKLPGRFALLHENGVFPKGFWVFLGKDTFNSDAFKSIPFVKNDSLIENQEEKWMYFKEEKIRYYELTEAIDESSDYANINTSGFWDEKTKFWKVKDISIQNKDQKNVYAAELVQPTGLHPKLQVNLKNLKPPSKHCSLRGILHLPSTLFFDQYELSSMAEMNAGNLDHIIRIYGETDLEAPTYTLAGTGSVLWFQVFLNETNTHNHALRLELPLHTRYQLPAEGSVYVDTSFYSPSFYWDCSRNREPIKEEYISNLLLNSFVHPLTLIGPSTLNIMIPTANIEHEHSVRWITNTVILGMFFYITIFLIRKVKGHYKQS